MRALKPVRVRKRPISKNVYKSFLYNNNRNTDDIMTISRKAKTITRSSSTILHDFDIPTDFTLRNIDINTVFTLVYSIILYTTLQYYVMFFLRKISRSNIKSVIIPLTKT